MDEADGDMTWECTRCSADNEQDDQECVQCGAERESEAGDAGDDWGEGVPRERDAHDDAVAEERREFGRKVRLVARLLEGHRLPHDWAAAKAWTRVFQDEPDPSLPLADWLDAGWTDAAGVDLWTSISNYNLGAVSETCTRLGVTPADVEAGRAPDFGDELDRIAWPDGHGVPPRVSPP